MSAAAALRGSGNWVAYLNFGLPWLDAGSVIVSSAWAVTAAAIAAAAGLAGLARRDLPEALWLRGTAAVAALCALAGYSGPLGARCTARSDLLNGTLSALRNVFKIEPVLAVVLALGIAHVLARAVWRWRVIRVARRRGRRGGTGRPGAALPQRAGAAARFVHPGPVVLAAGGQLARRPPPGRNRARGAGRRARHLHLGPADRRADGTAGQHAVGTGQPGALHRGRREQPDDRGGAGDRVGDGLPRAGRVPGPGRDPLRPGPQRPGSRPARLHAAGAGPQCAARIGIHPGGGVRRAGPGQPGRPGNGPAGAGDHARVPAR